MKIVQATSYNITHDMITFSH